MKRNNLEKIVYGFKVVGIIAGAILAIIHVVKELASIPWAELAANGTLEHIVNVAREALLFICWLFIIWILHALAMFGIHKLWPDDYDEHGHRRK